jgi:glycosyltransferase involved in cell wall biosynthesis
MGFCFFGKTLCPEKMNEETLEKDKVVHLTTVHPPLDTRIYWKECLSLSKAGYSVSLIGSKKNITTEELKLAERNNVKIIFLDIPLQRFLRMTIGTWKVFLRALKERATVYHFHDPELIPVGLLLRLIGKRVIYDVHEDLPRQILSKYWIPPVLRGVVAKTAALAEWVAGKAMSGIAAVTTAIARRFPPHKTVVVQNFPLLSEFAPGEDVPYCSRPMLVAYVGVIATIRGVVEMVQAIEHLPEALGARLVLAGMFSPLELEAEVRKLPGWRYVDFVGWQTRSGVSKLLASSRVGLVLFHPEPNHLEAQPNKLFEYMMAGIPVVASNFPLWREIVEGEKCGLTVDPLDPKAIAEAIRWLLEHPEEAEEMGKHGRKAVLEKYNWEREAEKLLEFYRKLLCA